MTRFIPAQIQVWTGGQLVQSPHAEQQIDRFYRGISTDTRALRKDEIFLALKGEHFDGHDFVEKAIQARAGMVIVDEKSEVAMQLYHRLRQGEELPDLLLVEDTLKAYQKIAEGYRLTLLATVIGITGSVGKTTTRRMVASVVSAQVAVHETEENKNNLIGVPLTLLQADDADQVIVAELAMDRRGEIEILSKLAHPDIAIITNIGYSHAEYLGGRDNILKEKTDIVRGMKNNGFVLINGQDDLLCEWATEQNENLNVWLISNEPLTDNRLAGRPAFWAEDVKLFAEETRFVCKSNLDPDMALPVTVPAPGKYLVRAALFALASCYALGLDMRKAADACHRFANTGSRQRVLPYRNGLILDDAYNASPESVMTALESLKLLAKDRRRVVCLGGMRELGSYSVEQHQRVAEALAADPPAAVFLIGSESQVILEHLKERAPWLLCYHFAETEACAEALESYLQEGDCVLLKASRYYKLERIAERLMAAIGRP